jgi:hypothetical protein
LRAKFVLAIGRIRFGELTFEFSGAFLGVVFAHRQNVRIRDAGIKSPPL